MTTLQQDKDGNSLLKDGRVVYLKLASEKRRREVGRIISGSDTIIMERKQEHLLRKANAYGFNYEALKLAKAVKFILLHTPTVMYKFPISFALENGSFLWFKSEGFEKQIFLTLSQLEKWKTTQSVL